jgi:PAS domain S-box-containing protein
MTTDKKFCSREDFKQVITSSYDAIFVTDGEGNVILCNPATGKMLNVEPKKLMGKNVRELVQKGIYDRSIVLEALRARAEATGLIINRDGKKVMSTAIPIFNANGEIMIVVVNSRDTNIIEKYLNALENERNKADHYKTATEYLNQRDLDQNCIIAESEKMKEIINKCILIAKTDSTVVLLGESGTGKEVMARLIHRYSRRVKEPFIPVNCTAIPSQLLESELFGYTAGAFTGANPKGKPGIFEIAHKGTLFLDEIGELPIDMQPKLLRILETGEVQRLGSTGFFKTNVRIIAATNRDLQSMVKNGTFRSDLFYRLNVIPIELPPLRERPDDILALAELFLAQLNRKYAFKKELTAQSMLTLLNYHWPGNVRELRNVVERLVVTSSGDYLDFENDFLINKKVSSPETISNPKISKVYQGTLKSVLREVEDEYISQVLAQCNGHMGKAAERLGIHRTMLYRKIKANETENNLMVTSDKRNEP